MYSYGGGSCWPRVPAPRRWSGAAAEASAPRLGLMPKLGPTPAFWEPSWTHQAAEERKLRPEAKPLQGRWEDSQRLASAADTCALFRAGLVHGGRREPRSPPVSLSELQGLGEGWGLGCRFSRGRGLSMCKGAGLIHLPPVPFSLSPAPCPADQTQALARGTPGRPGRGPDTSRFQASSLRSGPGVRGGWGGPGGTQTAPPWGCSLSQPEPSPERR